MKNDFKSIEDFVHSMHKMGLSQTVADKCNVSIYSVWWWVRDNKVPEKQKIKLVKAFNLNPNILTN